MHLAKKIALRIIFLPLLFAALLLAAGALIVKTMFTPKNLEALVTDQLQQIFKRPVRIESAGFSLTGIKIKGLSVVEPGPQAVNFITADYIDATYHLLPLLKKSMVIDSLVLVSPRIELVKNAGGGWNFSDIIAAYRRSPGGKNRLSKMGSAEIRDGFVTVTYPGPPAGAGASASGGAAGLSAIASATAGAGTSYSFENVNLTVRNFKPGSDTPFSLSVFFKHSALKKYLGGRLYAEGEINLKDFDMTAAEIKNLALVFSALGRSVSVRGRVMNLRRPDIDLKAGLQALSSKDLAPVARSPYDFRLPATVWDLKLKLSEDRTLSFSARAEPAGALAQAAGGRVNAEGFVKFGGASPAYNLVIRAPPFELADFGQITPDLPVSEPSGKAQIRLTADNKDGEFHLSKIFLNSRKARFKYKNLGFSDLNLTAFFSESLKGSYLNITDGRLEMKNARFTNLALRSRLAGDALSADYSARWGGEPLKGMLVVSNPLSDRKTAAFTGYSKSLDLKAGRDIALELKKIKTPDKNRKFYQSSVAWLRAVKNSVPSGFASFKLLYKADRIRHDYLDADGFYLQADLRNIAGLIEKIGGDVSVKSGRGTFYDVQKTSERDRIYYILSLPVLTIYRLNRMGALKFGYKLNNVNFNAIGGDYTLNSGRVQIKNFFLDGKEFSLYTSGAVDLSAETINLKVYTISGKYYAMGSLPEALTDSSGKPALAFTIKGRMSKPDITMMSPTEAGAVIAAAIKKGVKIDFKKADAFSGGAK